MLTGFDHVTIAVHDIEHATRDYALLLGIAPLWRGTHPDLGTRGAVFGLSNIALELVAPGDASEENAGLRQHLAEHGEGLITLAFGTQNAAELSRSLRAQGVRATEPEDGEARDADGSLRRYRSIALSPRSTGGLSIIAVERPEPNALRAHTAPHPAAAHALDHIVVRSRDLDAARALYADVLGLRLALDKMVAGSRMLFFRAFGVTLEVVHAQDAERDVLYGLAYRVRDLDAAHARLSQAKLEVGPCRDGRKPGTRVFVVKQGCCNVPTLLLSDPGREAAARP